MTGLETWSDLLASKIGFKNFLRLLKTKIAPPNLNQGAFFAGMFVVIQSLFQKIGERANGASLTRTHHGSGVGGCQGVGCRGRGWRRVTGWRSGGPRESQWFRFALPCRHGVAESPPWDGAMRLRSALGWPWGSRGKQKIWQRVGFSKNRAVGRGRGRQVKIPIVIRWAGGPP